MGKEERKWKVAECSSSDEDSRKRKSPAGGASDDDDDEANADLSLEIVRRSIMRTANNDLRNDGVSEIWDLKADRKQRYKKKKKRCDELLLKPLSNLNGTVTGVDGEEDHTDKEQAKCIEFMDDGTPETDEVTEATSNAVETNHVGTSDNIVLRKLLRGPRYFDPPDNNWGTCYNCGEEGHTTVNCTAAKRKKPCFVCGSFEHNAKQCTKSRDCFICKQQGHRSKDCPEKRTSSRICLKCGDPGHDMFSCRNDYCPDDLKEIQCYICGSFGHLCCKTYTDPGPQVLSCYRCGLSGHTGLACTWKTGEINDGGSANSCYRCGLEGHFARECTNSAKLGDRYDDAYDNSCYKCGLEGHFARECTNSAKLGDKYDDAYDNSCYKCGLEGHFARECTNSAKLGDRYDDAYDNSCYKCGLEGHFARECTNSAKSGKRYRDPSTPKQLSSKKKEEYLKDKSLSASSDAGKMRKKKYQYQEYTPVAKTKQRGGWITEDPGYYYNSVTQSDNWRSPSAPNSRRSKFSGSNGDYISSSHSSQKLHKINFNDAAANGSSRYHDSRVSASRFSNSNNRSGRSYDWW